MSVIVKAIGPAGLGPLSSSLPLSSTLYNGITALLMDGRFHQAKQTLSNRAIAGH